MYTIENYFAVDAQWGDIYKNLQKPGHESDSPKGGKIVGLHNFSLSTKIPQKKY